MPPQFVFLEAILMTTIRQHTTDVVAAYILNGL